MNEDPFNIQNLNEHQKWKRIEEVHKQKEDTYANRQNVLPLTKRKKMIREKKQSFALKIK